MNKELLSRLDAVLKQLNAAYEGGKPMSATSKGREREYFIDLFLKSCFPPHFRFGTGEIGDSFGGRTGQIDIVIEYPFAFSLPLLGTSELRLYPADGVAAVLEVKSNL